MPQDVSSPWIFTDIRQWNALIRTAETVSLEKDAIIYEQGERAEYVYVVKTGRVRLTSFLPNGREQIFMFIEEGGMFGEAELFEGGVRLTDANAITDVVLYRSTLHDFRKLINTDIDFSNSVLALTSRKFSRLVGCVIGSGIFMTPGTVAAAAGSIGPTVIAWITAGVCGLLCALVYAELSPMMPKAGGAYVFIREAFGDGPAFAYGWSMTFGSFLPVIAMLATAFCTNLAIFFPGLDVTGQRVIGT